MTPEDIIGNRYRKLTVLSFSHFRIRKRDRYLYFNCLCDCGVQKAIAWEKLKNGRAIGCGCQRGIKKEEDCKTSPFDREYDRMHNHISRVSGKANKCLHCSVLGAKKYEWALIKGKNYSFNPEDYIPLCSSCHRKYDGRQETFDKISKSLKASCKNKGANAPSARKVVNSKTGHIYGTVKEAAAAFNLKRTTLIMMLRGKNKNKTPLKYAV